MLQLLYAAGLMLATTTAEPSSWPACGTVDTWPAAQWPSAALPSGWDGAALATAEDYFDSLDSAAAMVLHRGRLVASWGDVDERYDLASLRKSMVSALYGTQLDRVDLDATLARLDIQDREPPLTETQRTATVRHLLQSRSGIYHSAHYEPPSWQRRKAATREWALQHYHAESPPPGVVWLYNNWDFNTAAAVLEQVTGRKLGPMFQQALAQPLAMQDFRPQDVTYVGDDSYAERRMGNLSAIPAYMFTMSTRDLARVGLLYLGCGQWSGEQLIPRAWVLESTTGVPIAKGAPEGETIHDHFGDYAYMWWVDRPGSRTFRDLRTREPVFFGQGARGHYVWVAPYLDLVVVHQVATTGGIGNWGQIKRSIFGSDEISDGQFQQLLKHIINAHPLREEAFGGE